MHEPVPVSAAPAGNERRRLAVLLGIGVALVLLLLVVPRVLSGGGSDGEPAAAPIAPSSPSTVAPATPVVPIVPVAVRSSKDPFQPLVRPRAPEKAAPPAVAPTPSKTNVRLVDVYVDAAGKATAKLQLDGADLAVKAGQQFGGSFRVLDLDVTSHCGNFLFGDQPFGLCAGEATTQ